MAKQRGSPGRLPLLRAGPPFRKGSDQSQVSSKEWRHGIQCLCW